MITVKFKIREEFTEEVALAIKNHVNSLFNQLSTFEPTSLNVYQTPVYAEAEVIEETAKRKRKSPPGKKHPKAIKEIEGPKSS